MRTRYLARTEKFFYQGDFYTLRRASTILKHSGIDTKRCEEIRQFMKNVGLHGVDYAKRQTTEYLAKTYIKQLDDLGINPIPIPQNERVPFLPNPFRSFYEGGCVA